VVAFPHERGKFGAALPPGNWIDCRYGFLFPIFLTERRKSELTLVLTLLASAHWQSPNSSTDGLWTTPEI